MARTPQQIYDEIIHEVTTYSTLVGLQPQTNVNFQRFLDQITTTSRVAVWRVWVWIVTYAIWMHEKVFDAHREEVIEIIRDSQFGQLPWYVTIAKEFQLGYDLRWNPDIRAYEYPVIDTDARIVTQAAATDAEGVIVLKVAKDDGSDGLEPLSATEFAAFTSYIRLRQPAGININLFNFEADDLRFEIDLFYNAAILNSDGELLADSTTTTLTAGDKPVEIAITEYIQTLPFNSDFRVIDFVDAIQAAEGVQNIVVQSVEAKYGALLYTDILAEVGQRWNARAGHMKIDGTIATMVTYIAN